MMILRALLELVPFSLVILLVIGTIFAGIVTPTESAMIGIVCALVIAAILGKLSVPMLKGAMESTVAVTAMIMAIIFSSQLFSQLLAYSGTGAAINQVIGSLEISPSLMLFILMLIPFVICMFLDEVAAMMILNPIYLPIVSHYQFEPVWFWTIFLVNITLGSIAPPVGYVLFVMKGMIPGVSMSELFRAAWPYVALFIFAMFLMGAFPQITLIALGR